MTGFQELLEAREKANVAYSASIKSMQAAFEAKCMASYKAKFPKRKFTMAKSQKDNQPEHGEIYKKWNEKFDVMCRQHRVDSDKLKASLDESAKNEPIPAFDGMTLYATVDSGTYHSQGFGEHKYARADAEDRADKARAYGLTVYIREVLIASGRDVCGWSWRAIDYEVWISTNELGVEVLQHKSDKETMTDWVKKCDARSVCPRVFFPFMNYEEEEKFRTAGVK